ncbi:MAG: hypothetical protein WC679_12410 [Bacteroidales bacterium]|jgi:hypothetical protein
MNKDKRGLGQLDWTISLILIGLFIVAILGFCINFAIDNDAPISIASDPEISNLYTSTSGNLSQFNTGAQSTYGSIINSTISSTAASGTTATSGQFAITPINIISIIKNGLSVLYSKIFGSGSGFGIFITTFLGLIAFITALLIWKTWAGRSPD